MGGISGFKKIQEKLPQHRDVYEEFEHKLSLVKKYVPSITM